MGVKYQRQNGESLAEGEWHMGTIREIGGGALSRRLSSKDYDPRVAYVISMPMVTAGFRPRPAARQREETNMISRIVYDAACLASLALFLASLTVWAVILGG